MTFKLLALMIVCRMDNFQNMVLLMLALLCCIQVTCFYKGNIFLYGN